MYVLTQRPSLEHGTDGCTSASTANANLSYSSSQSTDVLFPQLATNGQGRIRIPSNASELPVTYVILFAVDYLALRPI